MKDKLMIFVIGLLVGAVISTSAFFVYSKSTSSCDNNQNVQMQGGQPPSIGSGQDAQGGQPPEKPSDDNTQNNSSNGSNTQNSNN